MTTTPHASWNPDDPVIQITVHEPNILTVKRFGVDYPTPPELGTLTRASFGMLMDHLWNQLRAPFTVEVIETDGTKHADIIDLRLPPAPGTSAPQALPLPTGPHDTVPALPAQPQPPTTIVAQPRPRHASTEPSEFTPATAPAQSPGLLADTSRIPRIVDAPTPPVTRTPVTAGSRFWPGEPIGVALLAGMTTADRDGKPTDALPAWWSGSVFLVGQHSGVLQAIQPDQQ